MTTPIQCLTGCLLALLSLSSLEAQEIERGKSIYETHCIACHDRSVHRRESRVAKDFDALRREVERWGANTNARLRPDEVDAVAAYLNGLYYKHPCPQTLCSASRARLDPVGH